MLNIVKVAGVKDLHVYMFPLRPSRLVMSVSGPLSFVVKKTKEKAGYYCHYFSPCVKQSLSMLQRFNLAFLFSQFFSHVQSGIPLQALSSSNEVQAQGGPLHSITEHRAALQVEALEHHNDSIQQLQAPSNPIRISTFTMFPKYGMKEDGFLFLECPDSLIEKFYRCNVCCVDTLHLVSFRSFCLAVI